MLLSRPTGGPAGPLLPRCLLLLLVHQQCLVGGPHHPVGCRLAGSSTGGVLQSTCWLPRPLHLLLLVCRRGVHALQNWQTGGAAQLGTDLRSLLLLSCCIDVAWRCNLQLAVGQNIPSDLHGSHNFVHQQTKCSANQVFSRPTSHRSRNLEDCNFQMLCR